MTRAKTTGTAAARRAQYGGGSTLQGVRTRALLLASAREVFERDGYLDARVADISGLAGVSHGTFYTYFRSKQEVFRALIQDVRKDLEEVTHIPLEEAADGEDWLTVYSRRVYNSNANFLDAYRKNARMVLLYEQVATIDPEVGRHRVDGRRLHTERITNSIKRLQSRGSVARDLDPRTAGAALASMVGNFAYYWLVIGEPFDDEVARSTLTKLWLGALGLPIHRVVEPANDPSPRLR